MAGSGAYDPIVWRGLLCSEAAEAASRDALVSSRAHDSSSIESRPGCDSGAVVGRYAACDLDRGSRRKGGPVMIARELMTRNPRTLFLDDSIGDAWRALDELEVRHLPIVNAADEIVGMLSDRDLVRTSRDSDRAVATLMSGGVFSLRPEAPLDEIVACFLDHHVGALPVVDEHRKVIGIVSYVDVLRALPAIVSAGPHAMHA
jgi:acetoin utilization protein AcuB